MDKNTTKQDSQTKLHAIRTRYKKEKDLLERVELLRTGNAGVNKDGQIVDKRDNPESTPSPCGRNKLDWVPENTVFVLKSGAGQPALDVLRDMGCNVTEIKKEDLANHLSVS